MFISSKYISKILFIITVSVLLLACKTNKDTIVSRNYHALTTKFNVLFNGKEAFNEGVEKINNDYKDDWFAQLPIEPIKFDEDKIVIKSTSTTMGSGFGDTDAAAEENKTPFDIAEEKAVKAIQKHGMNINGIERNSQIDDAYLLLGKARYYDQRFIPAIEAFNYVITNYPNASLIEETKIWRAKANIRIDNEEFAIESLKLLLKIKDTLETLLPDTIKEQGYTALAMAYVKADSLDMAKKSLIRATKTLQNKNQGARNLFILGQLYHQENKKDSALLYLNKLIDFKKAPYKYKMNAYAALAKNITSDSVANITLQRLQKLTKERENRAYLDALYYQIGSLYENTDSINLAVNYYNKSLRALSGSDKQKTYTFEKLANINFKNSNYINASAYFDSILSISKDTLNLRIRRIKRKHKNLASLISFEKIVIKNDSIIKIASLTDADKETYFKDYIENLKKKDEEAAQLKLNQQAFGANFGANSLKSNKKGKWYFYNSQSLDFGKTEFNKIWGNRALEDGWRWASKRVINNTNSDTAKTEKVNLRYNLETYINTIPTRKGAIDTLKLDRNNALYEAGIIYKEQFKDPKLAIKRLERVASLNPKEDLILPINWHLYNLYLNNGSNNQEALKYKNFILTTYPKTKFAQIINNPNTTFKEETSVNQLEETYKEIYYLFKEYKFEETVAAINKLLPSIQGSKLLPKFELLKAFAIGKFQNKESYEAALQFVAVNYGSTEEGKKAKEIQTQLKK